MRTIFIFLFLASIKAGHSQNQLKHPQPGTKDHTVKKLSFGFKGGYNHTDIHGTELNGAKTGYTGGELYGGFFADAGLNKRISFETELLFSWTDDFHFIEIPLHLKFMFARKWNVFAGPRLDIIADKDDVRHKFNNYGNSGELGLQYNVSRRFFVEVRHAWGFTKQVTDTWLDINYGRRNTFRAGLGIKF